MARQENRIKNQALALLKNGRPNFDIPHTLATAHWIKELLKTEKGNAKILVAAAYLHDIGYSQTQIADNWQGVHRAKKDHMDYGVKLAASILGKSDFSESEKKDIIRLVGVHDKLELLSAPDEYLLLEADSLGQIDISRVRSNFDFAGRKKFIESFEKNACRGLEPKPAKNSRQPCFPKLNPFI